MPHFPEELADVEIARQRLALDEFIELQRANSDSGGKNSSRARQACHAAATTGSSNRFWRGSVSSSPARKPGCCAKSARTWAVRASDAAVVAGRCRFGQNRRGRLHGADGAGKRLQRRAHGADGDSCGTTFRKISADGLSRSGVKVEMQTGNRKTSNIQHSTSNIHRTACATVTRHPSPVMLFIGTHALLTSGFSCRISAWS